MSLIDGFFNKGFKASKGKTLLKLTIPRIKLLRNKKEVQIKQMRRDISKLLQTGQEPSARIRVEHIIREENMMAAHEIIELFCELISVRLPIIEAQRECPLDLKESISSLCFAAPRCTDLPELLQLQSLFTLKYGKDFVSAASQLLPNCAVNRQLIEHLSVRPPSPARKLKLLKEIADEFDIEWDPTISEAEFSNPHHDLLNGSSQFLTGFRVPIPTEKHVNSEKDESILEMLDFPEVPRYSPKGAATGVLEDKAESGENGVEEEVKWVGPGVDMVELKDVLAAAKAATETAERAAAASREAQIRIKEIIKKKEEDGAAREEEEENGAARDKENGAARDKENGATREEEENPFYKEDEDVIFSYPDLFSHGPNLNPRP